VNPVKKTFQYGRHQVTLETGEIARQATGAVIVNMDDTVVLVTVVAKNEVKAGQDFFPLTVDYQEKAYAAGRIPGGFLKRESRNSEKETLICRLIDRPIRPLFPDGFFNEVQVIATVMSANPEVDSDIPALLGASAALALSGLPFDGPVGAARVGYIDGQYVLNPTTTELKTSKLNLVVAGTESAVLMVESEADQLPEDVMLGAVVFGHEQMQVALDAINDLADTAGKDAWDWAAPEADAALLEKMNGLCADALSAAYSIKQKQARVAEVDAIRNRVFAELIGAEMDTTQANAIKDLFHALEALVVRGRILAGEPRIDGRDTRTVRPITIRTGVLPRAHGSALFTRGETQALVVTTLGTGRDEQTVESLTGNYSDHFLLNYNMPPYATGEAGRMGPPKRREVGHGRLAKRALAACLPTKEEFGYTVRVVSEVTESNGSSSMASVCGGSLSLMDAGVPMKDHVAGIAMGLIKDGNRFAVLTDILGDEDHLGDMDFKVAGTKNGVNALQMDIKIQGITKEIMQVALTQAREARLHILAQMEAAVAGPRVEMSAYAPRIITMKINPEKIRDVIGKGGAVIRALTEETGTQIDIDESGNIKIACTTTESGEVARKRIEDITAEVEVGRTYAGTVLKILDFGAIVNVLPGKDGLLHISQIAHQRVNAVTDFLKEGQAIQVKVLETDDKGRMRLSMKALIEAPAPQAPAEVATPTTE